MWLLSALVILIGLHGLFVAAEYATTKIARMEKVTTNISFRSWRTARICSNMEEYLLVCQLGKTTTQLAIGMCLGCFIQTNGLLIDTAQIQSWLSLSQMLLGFGCMVLVITVFGFKLPKMLAINCAEQCAEGLSMHLLLSRILFWPLIWLIKHVDSVH